MIKEKKPLISIIVPVYNAEPYLQKCIDSIINQSYMNLEIILINDGSTDKSGEFCNEYQKKDTRIKVIHKENSGVSEARNAGLDAATGEFISFIDADDYIEPDFFAELIKYDADVVVSGTDVNQGIYQISDIIDDYYSFSGFSGPCEKLYKKSILNGVRFRKDLNIGEDIIFNLSVLKNIKTVFYTPYKGYHITNNPTSLTRSGLGKYNFRLDEEWQKQWGDILSAALLEAGISAKSTLAANTNGCSVWIYQKIKNYCYSNCPHPYKEKIRRIKRQLDANRNMILHVTAPTSPRTYKIIKFCVKVKNPHLTYLIFKLLTKLHF